ncbi:hypothetical protein OEA41_000667 [Lepraria neglecta]|uniref:Uncharacterized protein n=1 Tax=Lepraria neglecta TaxID=209136 RepID=A0AAD9ZGW2_9LECA|nr:hypothetical protein OEA41_000667 [Lepraria neglecta]
MSSLPIARRVLIGNMTAMQATHMRNVTEGEVVGYIKGEHKFKDVHSGESKSANNEDAKSTDYDAEYRFIAVAWFHDIPPTKHHVRLKMISEAALTRKEYENVVLVKKPAEEWAAAKK